MGWMSYVLNLRFRHERQGPQSKFEEGEGKVQGDATGAGKS